MRSCGIALVAAVAVCAGSAFAGPDWIEGGGVLGADAGSLLTTAEPVLGTGQLRTISGRLTAASGISPPPGSGGAGPAPDYEDMFLIRIDVPSTFLFEVGTANFDAQLFLFNITLPGEAFGLLGSNDTASSNRPLIMRPATDGTGADVVLPGVYAIAISGLGRVPVSLSGNIFNFASPTEISGPDGPGGINPHIGWTGIGQTGDYTIEVEDVGWVDVPAPGSALMFAAAAGLVGARRRRR